MPATVPGCVHTDLVAAGVIPDPFFGTAHRRLQWIGKKSWEYRTDFTPPRELAGKENIRLIFRGLDTFAEIYLNDSLILRADNMFRSWSAACSGLIRPGRNSLRVIFSPPDDPEAEPAGLNLPGGDRVYIRKAAYQFGWDWAPRLLTSGIWRPACLLGWDRGRIRNAWIIQKEIRSNEAVLKAEVELQISDPGEYRIEVSDLSNGSSYGSAAEYLDAGDREATLDFRIPDPELWWTNGLGDQKLYSIMVELKSEGSVLDSREIRIGLREIELITRPDSAGSSFFFRLNGVPVFMKGANYVPQDVFPSRAGDDRYRRLIESVRNMNMNMLRVWGGGIYERELFYDLCDENGILVWQDFMFACGMYPFSGDFLKNVRAEAEQTVRRLRGHCCIALWCGNNESDEGWHNWGWQSRFGYSREDSSLIWNGYRKLFHKILPREVERLDGTRDYISTSPKYGRGDSRSLSEGDFHNWWVWHDGRPFESYREATGRFMSEFGFQAFPPYQTVKSFVPPGSLNLHSEEISAHQKHPRGNELIRSYMERDYQVPSWLPDFIYISQLLQARGVSIGIEAQRRASPFCMGSLFWQLNDCWPAISFSCIDYYGRWKALAYSARRAFADLLVSPVQKNDSVYVHIVSDRLESVAGQLRLNLIDFEGRPLGSRALEVRIEPNSSALFFSERVRNILRGADRRETVLKCALYEEEKKIAGNLLYFASPGDLFLPEPEIEYDIESVENGCVITLRSGTLVKNLYMEFEGENAFFSDNFFDLIPGRQRQITVRFAGKSDSIEEKFRYRSLR